MAGTKEIRNKIKNIKGTQKITHAMEMVAASKMRKAQGKMRASRPYAGRLRDVIAHLVNGTLEYTHPYMLARVVKRIGCIVIATDRGLCGGLNANLFKTTIREMKNWHDSKVDIDICTFGTKAEQFFKRMGGNVVASVAHLGDSPQAADIIGPVKIMLDAYTAGSIDQVFLVYNEFISTMSQVARVEQLLPITADVAATDMVTKADIDTATVAVVKTGLAAGDANDNVEADVSDMIVAGANNSVVTGEKFRQNWDYIYEPSAVELLPGLLLRYIESMVYQAVVENAACEQAARMIAMKSATDNAGDLINEFQLLYNKARQAAITKELSEIISGAQAV